GIRLRGYRTALGMTIEEVGSRLDVSATKISRLETGKRKAILRDVRDLCEIYGITEPAEVSELLDLARQAREQGWWTRYADLALSPFIGLEQEASSITSFSMYYVPPLMQTADYARAMIRGIARRMEPKVLDERVEVRLRRQRLLDQPLPPRYRAIMDEAVLRRQVGGLRVMIEQLDKLLAYVADDKAAIQVIPFHVGAYGAADSNFDLLEFDNEPRQNSLIFVEGLFSNLYLERPDQIKRYGEAIEYLRDAALNPRDSATFIGKIRTDYNNSVEVDS